MTTLVRANVVTESTNLNLEDDSPSPTEKRRRYRQKLRKRLAAVERAIDEVANVEPVSVDELLATFSAVGLFDLVDSEQQEQRWTLTDDGMCETEEPMPADELYAMQTSIGAEVGLLDLVNDTSYHPDGDGRPCQPDDCESEPPTRKRPTRKRRKAAKRSQEPARSTAAIAAEDPVDAYQPSPADIAEAARAFKQRNLREMREQRAADARQEGGRS